MQECWGRAPFAAPALALALGIAAARFLGACSFAGLAAGAACLTAAAWLALENDRPRLSLALGLCAVSAAGALLARAQHDAPPEYDTRALLARGAIPLGEPLAFDGCVVEETVRRGADTLTMVELRGLQIANRWERCRGAVPLRLLAPETEFSLEYGDRIRSWARFDVPRNYQNPGALDYAGALRRKGIHLLARVKSAQLIERLPGDCGNAWGRLASRARQSVRRRLADLGRSGMPRPAAVLACIVLGDDSLIDPQTREAFQNSGTYHVLVVSGLHVAALSWALLRLLELLRAPPPAARVLTAAGILFYARVAGFQASVSRCLWMFAFYLAGKALFRRADPANIVLASGFCLAALSPSWLTDVGFQLSFLSVSAIALTGVPVIESTIRPLLGPARFAGKSGPPSLEPGAWHRLGRRLRTLGELLAEACGDRLGPAAASTILACLRLSAAAAFRLGSLVWLSIAVQLWIAPLQAYYFNRLSWIVPLANPLVVPLASLSLAAGVAAAVTGGVLLPASWAYRAAASAAALLCSAAERMAAIPAGWQRCPTPQLFLVLFGIALLAAWSLSGRRWRWIPWGSILILLWYLAAAGDPDGSPIAPTAGRPPWADDARVFRIAFLDVGQGDSAVIRFPDGRIWVLDAGGFPEPLPQGEDTRGLDTGEAVVSRFLWFYWVRRIDRIIASHAHSDHIGGIPALLGNFRVAGFQYAAAREEGDLKPLVDAARSLRLARHPVAAGFDERVAGVHIRVLHPPPVWQGRSPNDASIVLRMDYGRFSALLTGDLDGPGEARLVAEAAGLRSLLLKVPHHGSRSAAGMGFLDRVRPRWAVISAGRNNPFGNPSPETVRRLLRVGARLLPVSELGAVTFETDGGSYRLGSHRCGILDAGQLPSGSR